MDDPRDGCPESGGAPRDSRQSQNVPQADSARASRGVSRSPHLGDGTMNLFFKSMEQTRMAICLTDPTRDDNPIVFVNRAFLDLTGYPEEEVLDRNCRFLQGPDSDRSTIREMRRTIESEDVSVVEVLNYRKDGSRFWNALHIGPLYDDDGTLRYYFGSQWDVTDVHAARASEQQAKLLARELSHRMKNMFSVIGSVVLLTGRRHGAGDVAREINERIRALGRAYESTLDGAVEADVSLAPLLETVLGPYGLEPGGCIAAGGDEVRMDPNVVSTLGLVLHELATNAVKYGALSAPEGRVGVSWKAADDGILHLEWSETGGAPSDAPGPAGLGSEIVTRLLRMVDGAIEHDWGAAGLTARLRLPLHP